MQNDNELRWLSRSIRSQKEKENKLTIMEERFNSMQSQIQSLISVLGNVDQSARNSLAKQLFSGGVYEKEG